MRWLETSTKCSKHILCINYSSQAEARQITVDTVSKLTAKRQRLPDRGRSPRAPPHVHFRPPPSRPAKTTGTKSHTPKREIPRTHAVARHNERPQTIMALISWVPAPMLGTTNKLFRPNARDPQEHDSTPRRLSSVCPRKATHVLFTKNGPVESKCKLNNVNPHIIRNQIQNQIEVTLNEDKYCKSCHYQTNTEF